MAEDGLARAPPQSNPEIQLPHRKRRRSDELGFENQSKLGDEGEADCMLITHIRATNVCSRLRRIPIGFYVLVESEKPSQQTSNKPARVIQDVIEWEEEIELPSDLLSRISFTVFASFELGPMLGSGEMLFQIKVSLGELLEHNGQLESIRSWESDDGETHSLRSSLDINLEQRARVQCESAGVFHMAESEETRRLGEFTNAGHRALARYREYEEERDLEKSIEHFQDALELCPLHNLNRDTVLFNLATARLMKCRANENSHDLDAAIDLYRKVLDLRPRNHPDYPFALLSIGIALLARFQRGGTEADKEEGQDFLSKVLNAAQMDSYPYHAALLAFHSTARPELLQSLRDSQSMEDDLDEDEDEKVERLDAILQWIFIPDSSSHNQLDHLGILFCVQLDQLVEFVGLEAQIWILEVVVQFIPDSHPDKASWLHYLSASLWTRYEQLEDSDDLNKSISMKQDAVRLLPDDDEDKPSWLSTLCKLLSACFHLTKKRSDLDQAVLMAGEAVKLTPIDQPLDRAGWLSNLGNSLLTRYEHFGNVADLNGSISSYEAAVGHTPDDSQYKARWLNALGESLYTRHAGFGDLADLEGAISRHEDALRLAADSHPDKFRSLSNLANSLFTRYRRLGNIDDLGKSISLNEEALELVDDHVDKPMLLNELGRSLLARYERFGGLLNEEKSDLERAITVGKEALQLTFNNDSNKSIRLSNLGGSLLTRYKRFGNIDDLKRSIALREEAVLLTVDGNPNKPIQLNNLALSLWACFVRFGDVTDLRKVISLHEDAVQLAPNGHPDKALLLDGLGNSLLTRYERFGDIADLQRSILVLEEAVQLTTSDNDPHKPAWLNNLGNALSVRYGSFGDVDDLERVISVHGAAVQSTPHEHADKPVLVNNLANAFVIRYERFGELADLGKSISLHKEALRLAPNGHPYKPGWLNDLGASLFRRFECSAEIADLNESISRYEEAVDLTTDDHPDKPGSLNNLGGSLYMRFERLGDDRDLERSILVTEKGMGLVADVDGHPDKPLCLYTLACSLLTRFRHSGSGPSSSDLSKAILYSSQAARFPTSPSIDRFRASQLWIECVRSVESEDYQSLLDAYTVAVHLLPQLAWIGLPLHDRYHQLLRAADIACDAAAAALKASMPERAMEWLEQGRSVVWSQLLQLRSPVDELRVKHRELSEQFERISRQLERATSSRETVNQATGGANTITESLKERIERRHALAIMRESLIAQIRTLPGFKHFLLPKKIDQLTPLAHSGPVVFLNASKFGCDALIALADSERRVVHIPLSEVSYSVVKVVQVQLRMLLKIKGRVILDPPRIGGPAHPTELNDMDMTPDQVFGYILPYLWDKVVFPVLDALGFSALGSELPRIFWCPTGRFTFLPIHAAGHYGPANHGPRLSGFAISSYVPSISALELPPQEEAPESTPTSTTTPTSIRLLGVRQPSTDGAHRLRGVEKEMEVIKGLSSRSQFVTFEEADGTVEDVLDKLRRSDWVHFACHGVQDRADPLESGLLLAHGRRLRISDIVSVGAGGLPSWSQDRDGARSCGGSFAFLSACQTATGDEQLTEESVHVAAGMLLAGYGSIVATMWSIMDRDAPQVAEGVYERLFFDPGCGEGRPGELDELGEPRVHPGPPNGRGAAAALHHAIEGLRESGVPFLSWVPFIHVGL